MGPTALPAGHCPRPFPTTAPLEGGTWPRWMRSAAAGSLRWRIRCVIDADISKHTRWPLDVDPNSGYSFHEYPYTQLALGVGSSEISAPYSVGGFRCFSS